MEKPELMDKPSWATSFPKTFGCGTNDGGEDGAVCPSGTAGEAVGRPVAYPTIVSPAVAGLSIVTSE